MTAPPYSPADMPLGSSSVADVAGGVNLLAVSGRPSGFGPQEMEFHSTAGATVSVVLADGTTVAIVVPAGGTRSFRGHSASVSATGATSAVLHWYSQSGPKLNP